MSLLVDKEYLILQLRLAYLRRVDDHAGPRVISVSDIYNLPASVQGSQHRPRQGSASSLGATDPPNAAPTSLGISGLPQSSTSTLFNASSSRSTFGNNQRHVYASDSAVVVAGLNDARYQPELATLHSPKFVDQQPATLKSGLRRGSAEDGSRTQYGSSPRGSQNRKSLGYTTTIYGPGRSGALGMRTTGRRTTSADTRRRTRRKASDPTLQKATHAGFASESNLAAIDATEKPVPRRLSDLTSQGNASEPAIGAGTPPFREIPTLQVQGSSQDSPETRNASSRRSTSLRIKPNRDDAPDAESAHSARLRSQSSSHARRPSHSSLLGQRSIRYTPRTSEEMQRADTYDGESDTDPNAREILTPPQRPVRRPRVSSAEQNFVASRNEISQRTIEGDAGRANSGESAPPLLDIDGSTYDLGVISSHGDDSSMQQAQDSPPFERSFSDMTIFSLASPRAARKRGTSIKSENSDESGGQAAKFDVDRKGTGARARSSSFAPLSKVVEHWSDSANDAKGDVNLSPTSRGRASSDPRKLPERKRDANLDGTAPKLQAPFREDDGKAEATELDKLDQVESDPHENDLGPSAEGPSSSVESVALITAALNDEVGSDEHRSPTDANGLQQWVDAETRLDDELDAPWKKRPTIRKSAVLMPSSEGLASDITYEKRAILPKASETRNHQVSALSALLNQHGEGPTNPFASNYKGVAGSSVASGGSVTIEMYFPFAKPESNRVPKNRAGGKTRSGAVSLDPSSKSMQLSIRKDAMMEELIGYSLYCYIEEGWQPLLEDTLPPDATDEQREARLNTIGWTMRIVEDGEVDDDYPALDRSLAVGKFGADELAVCEASASQIKQNQAVASEQKQARNPPLPPSVTRLQQPKTGGQAGSATARLTAAAGNAPAGSLISVHGTPIFSSSVLGDRQGTAAFPATPPIFLRVLVTPNPEVRYKTTLQVTSDRYLADVLETICKRRDLGSPEKWALIVSDKDVVVPLDRTVESLQGNYDLALVRRQDLGEQQTGALTSQSTNPNASIFKRMSQPVQPRYQTAAKQLASTFKSYTVNRRMPTFLGRHERVLTIDGSWLHIIPTDSRAFHTNATTSSFPARSIISCTQSRLPSMFKLIVARETDQKRYDFEAESSKVATEIVQEINRLLRISKQEREDDEAAAAGNGGTAATTSASALATSGRGTGERK